MISWSGVPFLRISVMDAGQQKRCGMQFSWFPTVTIKQPQTISYFRTGHLKPSCLTYKQCFCTESMNKISVLLQLPTYEYHVILQVFNVMIRSHKHSYLWALQESVRVSLLKPFVEYLPHAWEEGKPLFSSICAPHTILGLWNISQNYFGGTPGISFWNGQHGLLLFRHILTEWKENL